jgi:hypothetical protein
MGVLVSLAPFTTAHAFQVEIHHLLTLTLGIGFNLAVASNLKIVHISDSLYVCLTVVPDGFLLFNLQIYTFFAIQGNTSLLFFKKIDIARRSPLSGAGEPRFTSDEFLQE